MDCGISEKGRKCGIMERSRSVEDRVGKWLGENGYDYEVRTYRQGENPGDCVEREKETNRSGHIEPEQ